MTGKRDCIDEMPRKTLAFVHLFMRHLIAENGLSNGCERPTNIPLPPSRVSNHGSTMYDICQPPRLIALITNEPRQIRRSQKK